MRVTADDEKFAVSDQRDKAAGLDEVVETSWQLFLTFFFKFFSSELTWR